MNAPRISIIVPLHNDRKSIERAVSSVGKSSDVEIIIVDSASTDGSGEIARELCASSMGTLVCLPLNEGPGVARDAGLEVARGQYVMFLDSDDELSPGWFERLNPVLDGNDMVAFNWRRSVQTLEEVGPRRDMRFLSGSCEVRRRYLRHQMDGSVIYTAFSRNFLMENNLRFRPGLHEDVDYIFRAYLLARVIGTLDQVLYVKHDRETSITRSVSKDRIRDYLDAWMEVWEFNSSLTCDECGGRHEADVPFGAVGAVVSICREVVRWAPSSDQAAELIAYAWHSADERGILNSTPTASHDWAQTAYAQLWRQLETSYSQDDFLPFVEMCRSLEGKSWSCVDLQGSLFLTPSSVRTCCKRFYVDGERRGDVEIPVGEIAAGRPILPRDIASGKASLKHDINSGEPSPCSGCPFLKFQEWPSESRTTIRYLSMEHHSVCNLRCSYCDDEYFGGRRPIYDVAQTIEALAQGGSLEHCHTVVWGGGEPTLDPDFARMTSTVSEAAPSAVQRILTNSVRFSSQVLEMAPLQTTQIITSVDAGTQETFRTVRGRGNLDEQLKNIADYARATTTGSLTVKFIFTNENSSESEVKHFVDKIREFQLEDCLYQISSDFKEDVVTARRMSLVALLYGLLCEAGVKFAFLDDLLQLRINWSGQVLSQRTWLKAAGGHAADPSDSGTFEIWGAGEIAQTLIDRPGFVGRWGIHQIIDHRAERVGGSISGIPIVGPSALNDSSRRVLPLGVQGMSSVLAGVRRAGVEPSRWYRRLVW